MKRSKRTKERIKQHDLVIDEAKMSTNIVGFQDRVMVFARCSECGWFGWLPKEDL